MLGICFEFVCISLYLSTKWI